MESPRKPAASLLKALAAKQRILVLTHDNPDPDAIASAMAVQTMVETKLGHRPVISFGGIIGRAENRAMVECLEITLTPFLELDVHQFDAVVLVDTQPRAGNNSLPRDIVPAAVIDHHHPRQRATRRSTFVDLRPECGACSTVLVEYLQELAVPIDPCLATALFYGIKTDTQDLGRHASQHDVDAYMHLFPLTDKKVLPKIEYPRLPPDYFETFHAALESARVYEGVVVVTLDEIHNPNVVAEVADLLLRLERCTWSIAMGYYQDQLFISVRVAGGEENAHDLIQRAIGSMGTGGGHGMVAGGRIPLNGLGAPQRARMRDGLAARFVRLLHVSRVSPAPLIRPQERSANA